MTVLFWVLLLLGSDKRKEVQVVCPVDGGRFTAYEVTSDEWGGKDLDFCPHAIKTIPLDYKVWTCAGCGYSGLKKHFDAKLTDEERAKLRAGLKPAQAIARGARQAEIPGWVKFDLMAQSASLLGAPAGDVGRAYLYASWSARQQGAVYLKDFDEWEALRDRFNLNQTPMALGFSKNRTDFELEAAKKIETDLGANKLTGVNRVLGRYLAAFLYRRHGENAEASKGLAELEKLKGENSVVDDAAAKMKASIEREREFQRKALEPLAAEVAAGKAGKTALGETAYLVGELHRRLGDPAKAAEWYKKAVELTDVPALSELARKQLARVEGK